MKPTVSILFIIFCTQLLFAQNVEDMTAVELGNKAKELTEAGQYEEAVSFALKSMEKAKAKGDDTLYAKSMNNLGSIYVYASDMKSAAPILEKALYLVKNAYGQESKIYIETLMNSAGMYWMLGNYEAAAPIMLEALNLSKKVFGEEHATYAYVLNGLAITYDFMGNTEAAESMYLQSLEIRKKTLGEKHISYAESLNNLAGFYDALGRDKEALPFFLQALEIRKAVLGEEHPLYLQTINNLAALYEDLGDFTAAESLYLKVLQQLKKQKNPAPRPHSLVLNNLAHLYSRMELFEKAEAHYLECLSIREKSLGKLHPFYISTLNNLGRDYFRTGRYTASMEMFRQALFYNAKTVDSTLLTSMTATKVVEYDFYEYTALFNTYQGYSFLRKQQYKKTKNKAYLDSAYAAIQTVMQINDRLRNSFVGEQDKYRTLSFMHNFVADCFEIATETGFEAKKKDLFCYAEQNKSILLADALKGSKARNLGDLPDSLAAKEEALHNQSDMLKREEIGGKTPEEIAKINAAKSDLNLEIDAFKKILEKNYPKYLALKYNNITAQIEDVQASLDDKTLFLEYFFIADSSFYLFAISKQEVNLYTLKTNKPELATKIKEMRLVLSDYKYILKNKEEAYLKYTKSASWCYNTLLKMTLSDSKIDRLIIVADGELGHLPFEAFLTESINNQLPYKDLPYLLNKYKISYNYSATLWKETLNNKQTEGNGRILAAAASYKGKEEAAVLSRVNRAPHLRNLRDALQDLPAAKEEVAGLSKLFIGDFWFDENTNEKNFKAQVGDYSIIHLAMHGLLNQRAPILSSLAFSENSDSTEDNFLEAWEIAHLKLNAQLVVLSACETGYGKFQQGEGVMSLARSFMYAGVPSLVVSMWQVNDASTSLIMQFFYKNLAKGMDKATALQQAKLEYIGGVDGDGGDGITGGDAINRVSIAAHPAFWAPFIQLGDFRPIKISQKSSGYWWAGGIALGVLVLGGLGFLLKRKKSG